MLKVSPIAVIVWYFFSLEAKVKEKSRLNKELGRCLSERTDTSAVDLSGTYKELDEIVNLCEDSPLSVDLNCNEGDVVKICLPWSNFDDLNILETRNNVLISSAKSDDGSFVVLNVDTDNIMCCFDNENAKESVRLVVGFTFGADSNEIMGCFDDDLTMISTLGVELTRGDGNNGFLMASSSNAELNCEETDDIMGCLDDELTLVMASTFCVGLNCIDGDDSTLYFDNELVAKSIWLDEVSTFTAELNCSTSFSSELDCKDDERRLAMASTLCVGLNCIGGNDDTLYFDNELVAESIWLDEVSTFNAVLNRRDIDDSTCCLNEKLIKESEWLVVASTFSAELICGGTENIICCLDNELVKESKRLAVLELNCGDGDDCTRCFDDEVLEEATRIWLVEASTSCFTELKFAYIDDGMRCRDDEISK